MRLVMILLFPVLPLFTLPACWAQTQLRANQIEDAFVRNQGDAIYGDIIAATSSIHAASLNLSQENGVLVFEKDGPRYRLRSNMDLYLDPTNQGTAGAVIVPATLVEFPDFLGEKIRFYSHTYAIGVSPFNLEIKSDRNIRFHSDTADNLMVIEGDLGNVHVKNNLTAVRLLLSGPLQLHVVSSLPAGEVGQVLYLDHPSDDSQDGAYLYTGGGWQPL